MKPAWGTVDECLFISGLGTHTETPSKNRLKLLKQYEQTIPLRKTWGHISPAIIKQHAADEITELNNQL